MMMIPMLHVLVHGGILSASYQAKLSFHNMTAWFLAIAAYCAVDSYATISGFVSYGKQQKYSNIIYLYLQVVFYTVTTTVVFLFYKPELVGLSTIIKSVVPFAYNTYWYFTAYFCLFFFIPFLNLIIDKFEKATMQKTILISFVIFSVLPTIFHSDFGGTMDGFSFLWLAILYMVGAYIKKYGISFRYKNINLYGYFVCVVITWLSKIIIEHITQLVFDEPKGGSYLISYTSPTIVFCSIFLLLFFANMKCNRILIKFVRFFAPVSFGVYLFHEEPLIRAVFIKDAFIHYLSFNPLVMALAVIATALCIWFVGSLVDKIRLAIFNLLKIRNFCILAENSLNTAFASFMKHFNTKDNNDLQ
jgi:surface polysaccharide O-acyltransferase-like enzyme